MKRINVMRAHVAMLFASMALAATAAAQTPQETQPSPEASPAPSPTATPTEKKKPEVTTGATKLKVGGVLWANYAYDLTEGRDGLNGFDVGRAYVNVEPSWGDKLSARITPDLVRETAPVLSGTAGTLTPGNTTGNLTFRVKYAYLTYTPAKDSFVRLGMIPTMYTPFEEDLWGYRFVAQTATDTFYGMSSSDFGLSAGVKLLGGRLDVATAVVNGESYTRPERDKYKEWQTRATVQILPSKAGGLKATGYYSIGGRGPDSDKVRGVGLLSYQHDVFTVAAEYVYAHDGGGPAGPRVRGGGPGAFASAKLPFLREHGLNAMARVDLVDPDAATDDDGVTRIIAGVGGQVHEKVRFLVDLQRLDYEDERADAQVVFAHWEAKF